MNKPLIIGLTGGIGMGKSTVAKIFRGMGIPVHDADASVHASLEKRGKAVPKIKKLFPDCVVAGVVDRSKLGQMVFGKPQLLKKLEGILHPLVRADEKEFLKSAQLLQAPLVILEIPLLFETGAEKRCDLVMTVTAPLAVQKERVLKRKGMTAEKFKAIRAAQLPDKDRRALADFVIPTGLGLADTKKRVKFLLQELVGLGQSVLDESKRPAAKNR